MKSIRNVLFPLVVAGVFATKVSAHPFPDIPVRASFEEGKVMIEVLIDPRSFTEDPEGEPYTVLSELNLMADEKKAGLKDKAVKLVQETIFFELDPSGRFEPEFSFGFTGIDGQDLVEKADPVMLHGTAKLDVPKGTTGYRVIAGEKGELSVVFLNRIDGKEVPRVSVLFPGEESYLLELE